MLLEHDDSGTGRRARLLAQLSDASILAEGPAAALEDAVARARLTRCATIVVISPRGGVGKTTISIMLGALRSDEVLALDADSDCGSLGRVAPAGGVRPPDLQEIDAFAALAQGAARFAELDRTLWALPG